MNRLLAEFVGTFCLVLFGCGAIVVNAVTDDGSGGALGHVGVALTWGLVVMIMIDTFGDISGAHINPAVSIAFAAAGRLPVARLGPYIIAQCLGAAAAAMLLSFLFPAAETMGQTNPRGDLWQTFALEVALSLVLMLVILAVATGSKEKGLRASITIGATVAIEAMAFGPITGASMNPARSLGPALAAQDLTHLWIYLAACPLGAVLAIPLHRLIAQKSSD